MNKKLIFGIVIVVVVFVGTIVLDEDKARTIQWAVKPEISTTDWKTYTNSKDGYSFKYPQKLSFSTIKEGVNLSHTIQFDNDDGGCDMTGDSKLSKTFKDFDVTIAVVAGKVKPPYVDGTYSQGSLKGEWAYMGSEGCGQTKYYFPLEGNRTLVITKEAIQILSPVVNADARVRVLAVPEIISYEEAKEILNKILSTFKFTN